MFFLPLDINYIGAICLELGLSTSPYRPIDCGDGRGKLVELEVAICCEWGYRSTLFNLSNYRSRFKCGLYFSLFESSWCELKAS